MRFVAALAVCALFASAASAQPAPVWRVHTEHVAHDRAVAHGCLAANVHDCALVIQDECLAPYDEDARNEALARQCDWRAIAAWEDEMNATLATLRAHMRGSDLSRLNASQRAWNTSMLADVGLGMEYYAGGSISGPVGAHIRARATAQRAALLEDIRQMDSAE